jgi:hypothetical protein
VLLALPHGNPISGRGSPPTAQRRRSSSSSWG